MALGIFTLQTSVRCDPTAYSDRYFLPHVLVFQCDHASIVNATGLSKQVGSWDEKMKTFCGTPYYLAPEIVTQCRGAGYSKDVDWWALGIMAYELLIGDPPFVGQNPQEVYTAIVRKTMKGIISVTKKRFSPATSAFILQLLDRNVATRLGNGTTDFAAVKAHNFFSTIDWDMLAAKAVPVGYSPEDSNSDAHFNKMSDQDLKPPEPPKQSLIKRIRRKSVE